MQPGMPPTGGMPPVPAAPGGMPPAAGQPPQPGQGQRLTPEEMAKLDAVFTPEVMRILVKAMPELASVLGPFIEHQEMAMRQPTGAPPTPTSGLANVR